MKTARLLFLLSLGTLAIGCGGGSPSKSRFEDVTSAVRVTVRGFRTEDPSIRNVVAQIRVPGQLATVADGMATEDPFFAASIGKTMTAATVLRLVERGKIALDRPASQYLSPTTMDGLQAAPNTVTVRQLLNHTSGIADYVEDGERDSNGLPPFQQAMLAEPDHLWAPEEMLSYVREELEPANAPGKGWHYSDTNYVLLAQMVERSTGRPFHEAMRAELFTPLGMSATYMPWREPARGPRPPASVWLGEFDLSNARTLSADWGGGGFVTTVADLDRFLNAVLDGSAFQNRTTAALMRSWVPTGQPGAEYGLGLARIRTAKGDLVGHDGFFGSFMFRAEWQGANYVGSVNQAATSVGALDALVAAVESRRRG